MKNTSKCAKNISKKFKGNAKSVLGKQRTYITKVKEERTYHHHPLLWRYAEFVIPESMIIQHGPEKMDI
jgi:hypothetical protein